jgi:hypothetical protein
MGDIVEHVAKAMCEHDHGPASSSAWNVHFGQYREVAAPAIRATLEYLRENVTEAMFEALDNNAAAAFVAPQDQIAGFRAMISAALNDIEGGTG